MGKNIWLTEKQLGDLIWKDNLLSFDYCEDKYRPIFREFEIGNRRVDFAVFWPSHIELYELKITASIESVLQIVKYGRDLNEHLRLLYYFTDGINHEKCPKINLHLIARYFDVKIIEICTEMDICLWRVDVHSQNEISIDLEFSEIFPSIQKSPDLEKQITEHFGV